MKDIKKMTNWQELEKKLAAKENEFEKPINESEILEGLRSKVKGQEHVLKDVAKIIRINMAKKKSLKTDR